MQRWRKWRLTFFDNDEDDDDDDDDRNFCDWRCEPLRMAADRMLQGKDREAHQTKERNTRQSNRKKNDTMTYTPRLRFLVTSIPAPSPPKHRNCENHNSSNVQFNSVFIFALHVGLYDMNLSLRYTLMTDFL